ncbi:unnamed protein product [Sympodiomycopsis kandeliae]
MESASPAASGSVSPVASGSSSSSTARSLDKSSATRLSHGHSINHSSSPSSAAASTSTSTPTARTPTYSRTYSSLAQRTTTPSSAASKPRRSDIHQREVSQIRSESRAGRRPESSLGIEPGSPDSVQDQGHNTAPDGDMSRPTPVSRASLRSHTIQLRNRPAQGLNDSGPGLGSSSSPTDSPMTSRTITAPRRDDNKGKSPSTGDDSGDTYTEHHSQRSATTSRRRGDLRFPPSSAADSTHPSPTLASTTRKPSSSRNPLPSQFRSSSSSSSSGPNFSSSSSSRHQSTHGRETSEETILERDRRDSPQDDRNGLEWPSDGMNQDEDSTNYSKSPRRRQSSLHNRRRRYASDAQASDIPTFDYAGRAGTNSSRLSVDSSAAARHLASSRARTSSGPNSARPASRTSQLNFADSPSELLRNRKLSAASTSSGVEGSNSSSSGAYRPSSRIGSRAGRVSRAEGDDVFNDGMRGGISSPRMQTNLPLGPGSASDRIQALQSRKEALQNATSASALKQSYGAAMDDLRARIEDVDIRGNSGGGGGSSNFSVATSSRGTGGGGSNPSIAASSRTSSSGFDAAGITPPAPRLRSQMSHYGGRLGGSMAPASEPRRRSGSTMEHASDLDERANLSGSGIRTSSRLAGGGSRVPGTPDPRRHNLPFGINSHDGPSSRPTSRFSTASRNSHTPGAGSASSIHRPMTQHERNTRVAFEIFERHFAGANNNNSSSNSGRNSVNSPTAARLAGPESGDLVDKVYRFLETVSTLSSGLRETAQYVIQREIEVEIHGSSSTATSPLQNELGALKELDTMLASLMKQSDAQVRNLSDVLVAFTRADKERSRMMRSAVEMQQQQNHSGSVRGSDRDVHSAIGRQQQQLLQSSPSRSSNASRADVRRSATLGHGAHHSLDNWNAQQQQQTAQFDRHGNGPLYGQHSRSNTTTSSSGGTLRREVRDIGGLLPTRQQDSGVRSPTMPVNSAGSRSAASRGAGGGHPPTSAGSASRLSHRSHRRDSRGYVLESSPPELSAGPRRGDNESSHLSLSPDGDYDESHSRSHTRSRSEIPSSSAGENGVISATSTSPSALAAERRLWRRSRVGGGAEDHPGDSATLSRTSTLPRRSMVMLPELAHTQYSSSSTIRARPSTSTFAPSPRRPKMSDPSVDTAIAVANLHSVDDEPVSGGLSARRSTISSVSPPAPSQEDESMESNASGFSTISATSTSTMSPIRKDVPLSGSQGRTARNALKFVSQSLGRSSKSNHHRTGTNENGVIEDLDGVD